MRRFLLPPHITPAGTVTLTGDLYRHMVTVLRLQPADTVILCNGDGIDYHATVLETGNRRIMLQITDSRNTASLSPITPSLTLIQGLPKGDKFDLIIQKATELGINSIVAYLAAHSVVRISMDQAESRITRWNRIAAEASRQSERSNVPTVTLAKNLDIALRDTKVSVKLLLWERDCISTLKKIITGIDRPESVALLTGPEGGFSPDEGSVALANGFTPVSLGGRILRTETASLAAIAILQYQWGDMG